jgi:limonene-1,2-epoxide hydrolase
VTAVNPVAVIEDFIAAWNRMDFDAIVGALDTNVHYHNVPLDPIEGRAAVRAYLRKAWRFDEVDWELLNIAACGNTVLTERVDNFVINGHAVSLPVMGTFEVREGRIVAWRDYFDLAGYRAQLEAAGT